MTRRLHGGFRHAREHKYRAIPTEWNGIKFSSKAEARRAAELDILRRHGSIGPVEYQPRYAIAVNGVKICDYVADFAYFTKAGVQVVEDVKGFRTPVYKLKKKLFEAIYKTKLTEVKC